MAKKFGTKKNILTLVLSEKKILNETKKHNPPSVKWPVPNSTENTNIEGKLQTNNNSTENTNIEGKLQTNNNSTENTNI